MCFRILWRVVVLLLGGYDGKGLAYPVQFSSFLADMQIGGKKKSFECSEVTCNPILHIIARVRCYGVLLSTELSRTATALWIEGWSYFIWFRELPRIIHHFRMSLMQHQSQHMNPNARQPHQPEALSVDLLICTKIQRLSMSSSEAVPSTDILKCMCFQSKLLFISLFLSHLSVDG